MDRAPLEISTVQFQLIRRNGALVDFNPDKIAVALTKAFLAVEGNDAGASSRVRDLVARLTEAVCRALLRRLPDGGTVHIEDVQDQVELALMREGCHDVTKAYVLYREKRSAPPNARPGPTMRPRRRCRWRRTACAGRWTWRT